MFDRRLSLLALATLFPAVPFSGHEHRLDSGVPRVCAPFVLLLDNFRACRRSAVARTRILAWTISRIDPLFTSETRQYRRDPACAFVVDGSRIFSERTLLPQVQLAECRIRLLLDSSLAQFRVARSLWHWLR